KPQIPTIWEPTILAIARITDKVPRDDDPEREGKLLRVLRGDNDPDMRLWAVFALNRLDPRTGMVSNAVLAGLLAAERDPDNRVRERAHAIRLILEPYRFR